MVEGYRPGRHRVVCDQTGQEVWDDEVRRQWDGLIVRKKSWDPRHPQELIRTRPERGTVSPHRPVPDPIYLDDSAGVLLLEQSTENDLLQMITEDGFYVGLEAATP